MSLWRPIMDNRLMLSDFDVVPAQFAPGVRWSGFSDRVMGGVSDATLSRDTVAGRGRSSPRTESRRRWRLRDCSGSRFSAGCGNSRPISR